MIIFYSSLSSIFLAVQFVANRTLTLFLPWFRLFQAFLISKIKDIQIHSSFVRTPKTKLRFFHSLVLSTGSTFHFISFSLIITSPAIFCEVLKANLLRYIIVKREYSCQLRQIENTLPCIAFLLNSLVFMRLYFMARA